MSALESPLDALALNYMCFGFLTTVNTVWTLVAVITTAAVGVWRIRASSPRGKCTHEPSHPARHLSSEPTASSLSAEQPVSISAESAAPSTSSMAADWVGGTSGRFTLYYRKGEDDCGYDDVRIGGSEGDGSEGDDVEGLRWWGGQDSWEGIMKIRMGDRRWYRYQDLRVFDGSVVRLWDGSRRRKAAAPLVTCGVQGVIEW